MKRNIKEEGGYLAKVWHAGRCSDSGLCLVIKLPNLKYLFSRVTIFTSNADVQRSLTYPVGISLELLGFCGPNRSRKVMRQYDVDM